MVFEAGLLWCGKITHLDSNCSAVMLAVNHAQAQCPPSLHLALLCRLSRRPRRPDLVVFDTYDSSAAAFESAARLMSSLTQGAECRGRAGSSRLLLAAALAALFLSCCLWWLSVNGGKFRDDL